MGLKKLQRKTRPADVNQQLSGNQAQRSFFFPLRVLTFIVCWPTVSHQRASRPPDSPSSRLPAAAALFAALRADASRRLAPAQKQMDSLVHNITKQSRAEQPLDWLPGFAIIKPAAHTSYTPVTHQLQCTFKASSTFRKHLPARREKDAGVSSTHALPRRSFNRQNQPIFSGLTDE